MAGLSDALAPSLSTDGSFAASPSVQSMVARSPGVTHRILPMYVEDNLSWADIRHCMALKFHLPIVDNRIVTFELDGLDVEIADDRDWRFCADAALSSFQQRRVVLTLHPPRLPPPPSSSSPPQRPGAPLSLQYPPVTSTSVTTTQTTPQTPLSAARSAAPPPPRPVVSPSTPAGLTGLPPPAGPTP